MVVSSTGDCFPSSSPSAGDSTTPVGSGVCGDAMSVVSARIAADTCCFAVSKAFARVTG